MGRHGWRLLSYTEFSRQRGKFKHAVERARRKHPQGFTSNSTVKLLRAVDRAVSEIIPPDPSRAEYRQGNTLGRGYRHWRRAKIGRRFRLFFRCDAKAKVIVYVWMNDARTLWGPKGARPIHEVVGRPKRERLGEENQHVVAVQHHGLTQGVLQHRAQQESDEQGNE